MIYPDLFRAKPRKRSRGKRSLILVLTAILIFGLAALAFAQRAKKPKAEEPKTKAELKLSDEQKQKMQAIRRQAAKEMIRLNADRRLAHLELRELLEAESPNQAAVDRQVQRLAELNAQATKSKLQSRIAAGSVLSKEQKAGMRKMMGNRMKMRMHQRMKVFRMPRAPHGRGPMMMFRGRGGPMPRLRSAQVGMESEKPGEAPAPEPLEMGFGEMEQFEPFAFFDADEMEPMEWEFEEMAPMPRLRSAQVPDFPAPPADDEGWR